MQVVHSMLLKAIMKEAGIPALAQQLERAGHYYSEDYIFRAVFGEIELETKFLGNVCEALSLKREEVRDLGEAHLYYLAQKEAPTTDSQEVSA